MAIKINAFVINKKEFVLENKTLVAEYSPEVDDEFGNILLEMSHMQDQADDLEDAPLEEQKAELKRLLTEMGELGSKYIKALFNEEDAAFILDQANGRVTNIYNLVGVFFEAGKDDSFSAEQGRNRAERRQGN